MGRDFSDMSGLLWRSARMGRGFSDMSGLLSADLPRSARKQRDFSDMSGLSWRSCPGRPGWGATSRTRPGCRRTAVSSQRRRTRSASAGPAAPVAAHRPLRAPVVGRRQAALAAAGSRTSSARAAPRRSSRPARSRRSAGTADPTGRGRRPSHRAAGCRCVIWTAWRRPGRAAGARGRRAARRSSRSSVVRRRPRVDPLEEQRLGGLQGADAGEVALVEQGRADRVRWRTRRGWRRPWPGPSPGRARPGRGARPGGPRRRSARGRACRAACRARSTSRCRRRRADLRLAPARAAVSWSVAVDPPLALHAQVGVQRHAARRAGAACACRG